MKQSVLALIVTMLAGLAGLFIGAMLNMEGYLGIITAIAVMGYFIISAIEGRR